MDMQPLDRLIGLPRRGVNTTAGTAGSANDGYPVAEREHQRALAVNRARMLVMADEPGVGDFIILFDSDSDEAQEPPILLVRMTEDGYEGIAEGWLQDAERIEAHGRVLAQEAGVRAWRHVGDGYTLLPPSPSSTDVH